MLCLWASPGLAGPARPGVTVLRPACGAERDCAGPRARLVLSADHLEYSPRSRTIQFQGNVRASFGELRLRCHRLRVLLDAQGRPLSARARARTPAAPVRLSLSDRSTGQGHVVDLDPVRRRVQIIGAARVEWGPLALTLQGSRIALDLRSGKLQVHQARAHIGRGGR